YRAARDRLLEREIELRRAMEAVAAARRELPPGGPVPHDYVFHGEGADGAPTDVRLSELFAPGKDSLAIYSFMFPRDPGRVARSPRVVRRGDRSPPTAPSSTLAPPRGRRAGRPSTHSASPPLRSSSRGHRPRLGD